MDYDNFHPSLSRTVYGRFLVASACFLFLLVPSDFQFVHLGFIQAAELKEKQRKTYYFFCVCSHADQPADAALLHRKEQRYLSCSLSYHEFPAKPAVETEKRTHPHLVFERPKCYPKNLSNSQIYSDLNGILLLGNI